MLVYGLLENKVKIITYIGIWYWCIYNVMFTLAGLVLYMVMQVEILLYNTV